MSVKSAEKRSEDEDRTPLQTAIHKLTGFGLVTAKVSLCVCGGGQPGRILPLKRERRPHLSHTPCERAQRVVLNTSTLLARVSQGYAAEVPLATYQLPTTNVATQNEHTDANYICKKKKKNNWWWLWDDRSAEFEVCLRKSMQQLLIWPATWASQCNNIHLDCRVSMQQTSAQVIRHRGQKCKSLRSERIVCSKLISYKT